MNTVAHIWPALIAACVGLACAGERAVAQLPPQPLDAVDQGVADLSPLSMSLRDLSVDMRLPTGFSKVYAVPGSSAELTRANGALYATFAFSSYQNTEQGAKALVPAGTVFHIGAPWESPLGEADRQTLGAADDAPTSRLSTRWGLTMVSQMDVPQSAGAKRSDSAAFREWEVVPKPARLQADSPPTAQAEDDPAMNAGDIGTTIVTDETYRSQRLTDLLRKAANEEKKRTETPPGAAGITDAESDLILTD